MRRIAVVVALGVVGLALAVSLSFGAFALAGHSLGRPATTIQVPAAAPTKGTPGDHASPSPTASRAPAPSPSLSPTDDHGDGGGHGPDD